MKSTTLTLIAMMILIIGTTFIHSTTMKYLFFGISIILSIISLVVSLKEIKRGEV